MFLALLKSMSLIKNSCKTAEVIKTTLKVRSRKRFSKFIKFAIRICTKAEKHDKMSIFAL
jgi:hypothetical protein